MKELTEAQKRFVELDEQKETHSKFFDEYRAAAIAVAGEIGLGAFFQDSKGVVYQTGEPGGKFVYFEKVEIKRTRRADEEKGSLSLTIAEAAGFTPANGDKRKKKKGAKK